LQDIVFLVAARTAGQVFLGAEKAVRLKFGRRPYLAHAVAL